MHDLVRPSTTVPSHGVDHLSPLPHFFQDRLVKMKPSAIATPLTSTLFFSLLPLVVTQDWMIPLNFGHLSWKLCRQCPEWYPFLCVGCGYIGREFGPCLYQIHVTCCQDYECDDSNCTSQEVVNGLAGNCLIDNRGGSQDSCEGSYQVKIEATDYQCCPPDYTGPSILPDCAKGVLFASPTTSATLAVFGLVALVFMVAC